MATDSGPARSATSPPDSSDAQLIAATRAGSASAFETLVRRYYRLAFAVALAHADNRADAEDVCHDAFVRAGERLEECRKPDRFAPWLCTIVRNRARNVAAHRKVRRASALEHDTAASGDNPERDAYVSELRSQLIAALATLSPVQREVALLHDVDERTHDEIATIVGTSSGMSRQHLFNARKKLRAALGARATREYFDE
jgi:RNA polymerase sigma-70 factor, ECF subfamily